MILLLMLAPLPGVQAQEGADGDATGQEVDQSTPDGAGDEFEEIREGEGEVDPGEPEAATEEGARTPDAPAQPYQVYLPAILGGDAAAGQVEAAFLHAWSLVSCTNVVNSTVNRGLWDDMPGPGLNNEAGLLWFVTNDALNEQCTYRSLIGGAGVPATQLRFRAAVNDNARLQIGLYRRVGAFCLPYLAFNTAATQDHNAFVTSPLFGFNPAQICRVHIMLTDDPDAFNPAIDRTSALIDYVRLYNNGVLTWQETFSN
jgi:hypothetical protein